MRTLCDECQDCPLGDNTEAGNSEFIRPKQVSILQVSKYPSVQVSQVSKYPSIPSMQMYKYPSIPSMQVSQVCKYAGACSGVSSEKTSLPEFFCSASLCEASKKITGNGFFPTFVTQLDSKFWPGFASQKSRSSFCFTTFDFRFLSKFLISFA